MGIQRKVSSTWRWGLIGRWRSEIGVLQIADNKKGPTFRWALLDRPAERILFGRRDWTRTNDPHHVKVTAKPTQAFDIKGKIGDFLYTEIAISPYKNQ